MTRHKKICSENPAINNDQIIKDLTTENAHLKDKIEMLQSEMRSMKTIVSNAGSIIKTSVSTVSYIVKNYKDAPTLEPLIDYDAIQYNEKDDEFDLMTMIFHHQRKHTLAGYLGDFIVKSYKKDDPSQQALWSSDAVRLTYVVREIINKKSDWSVDKKGVKTTSYIIDPFLEYIRTLLVDFNDENKLENYLQIMSYLFPSLFHFVKQTTTPYVQIVFICSSIIVNEERVTICVQRFDCEMSLYFGVFVLVL